MRTETTKLNIGRVALMCDCGAEFLHDGRVEMNLSDDGIPRVDRYFYRCPTCNTEQVHTILFPYTYNMDEIDPHVIMIETKPEDWTVE